VKALPDSILDVFVGPIYCTRVAQATDVVAVPKPWFGNRGEKGTLSAFALPANAWVFSVAETPRKPTVEKVGAVADIMARRYLKTARLSLRQRNRIADTADRTRHGLIVSSMAGAADGTT